MLEVGDVLPLGVETRDASSVLTDPGQLQVTLTLPDGSALSGQWTIGGSTGSLTIVRESAGVYRCAPIATASGLHTVRWVATGALAAAYVDAYTVAEGVGVCSLAELREHLRKSSSATDEQIRHYGLVATEMAEEWLGQAIRRRTVVEHHLQVGSSVMLSVLPVMSVASVTVGGDDITSSCTVDLRAGVITMWHGMSRSDVVVTYVAGRAGPLARHVQGVREIARHLWDTQRGGSQLPRQGAGDEWSGESGWTVPRRVMELLGRRPGGFA